MGLVPYRKYPTAGRSAEHILGAFDDMAAKVVVLSDAQPVQFHFSHKGSQTRIALSCWDGPKCDMAEQVYKFPFLSCKV